MMYQCIMKNNIHESIYDISEYIYFLLEGNMYSDEKKLIYDLNNFIDNYINNMTLYELNNVIIHYGINNAVAKYREDNDISNIDSNNFIRIIIKNLVKETYKIDIV
jgi:hypothetical protein